MFLIPVPTVRRASAVLRDRFLDALDRDDQAELADTIHYLAGCDNPLPRATCVRLGLAPGSNYGDAASMIAAGTQPGGSAA